MIHENDDTKGWLSEFQEFTESAATNVPRNVSENIFLRVQTELNPSPWKVFSKVGVIQIIVGLTTLLFCPQFGISLTGVHGLMHVLMRFGETVCMFGCGVLFVGSSLLASALLLSSDEVRILRKNEVLQVALLSLLTVGAFLCLGGQVFEGMTLVWLLGSLIGGVVSLELGWLTRKWIRTKVIYG